MCKTKNAIGVAQVLMQYKLIIADKKGISSLVFYLAHLIQQLIKEHISNLTSLLGTLEVAYKVLLT